MNVSMFLYNNLSLSKRLEPCYILRPIGYYLLFICIVGISLNAYVLYLFIRHKNLRQSSTNIFICGLILADFIEVCFDIPLPTIALIGCRWIFSYVGCVMDAIMAYFTGCSNMYMLCFISIDRYLVVTRSVSTSIITVKRAYIIIICGYLLALFWTLLPVIGWSSYDYEGIGASCSIKWEERSLNVISYNITIFIFVYLIPVIIILITNISAYKVIREHRRRTSTNLDESHCQRQYLIERRVTFTIILIISSYMLAWTPYAIMSFICAFIDAEYFPPIFSTIPALFAKTSVIWNPLIYVVRNGNIRHYFPFHRTSRSKERSKTSDPTRFSNYPFSAVQLPLTSTSSSRQV